MQHYDSTCQYGPSAQIDADVSHAVETNIAGNPRPCHVLDVEGPVCATLFTAQSWVVTADRDREVRAGGGPQHHRAGNALKEEVRVAQACWSAIWQRMRGESSVPQQAHNCLDAKLAPCDPAHAPLRLISTAQRSAHAHTCAWPAAGKKSCGIRRRSLEW